MSSSPTAAILLVGNELLSGRVRDENLPFLAAELWRRGVRVTRALVVRDDVEAIARAVRELSGEHTYVITTGGIGPTHDDRTIAGVAQAFGLRVVEDPTLASLIRNHLGDRATPAHFRMARIPEGAALEREPGSRWPVVRVRNVFLLPGVPELVRRKFAAIAPRFSGRPLHRGQIELAAEEAEIAPVLDRFAEEHPDLEVGSYPDGPVVLVTVEGPDREGVERAVERLRRLTSRWRAPS